MTGVLFGESDAGRRNGYAGHEVHATKSKDVWLTPPELLDALGPFDLDPCAAPEPRPWPTARRHFTAADNGLRQQWRGRVWLNPPYSSVNIWVARLVEHGTGTALLFARTDTALWRRHIWPHAAGYLFLAGRLHFHHATGMRARNDSGAPSVLVAFGADDAERLRTCRLPGAFVVTSPR